MSDGRGSGLNILFDLAIDGGAWPGVLRGRQGAVGELWLGPAGLLDRLEGELGLGAPWLGPTERACALASLLRDRDGWWRDSLEADALGTCERLLRDRELLVAHGWRGESVGVRLDSLWDATTDAPPGPADRVRVVTDVLAKRRVDIAQVCTASPLATLDPGWRALLARLVERGTRVEEIEEPTPRAPGDLGHVQEALAKGAPLSPEGDGSLVLLRAYGVLAAADQVAAMLAERASLDGALVIGADDTLDAALSRHGLPRTGRADTVPASAALIQLVIEAAFTPMEPADLHALLCLQPGPVPRGVARKLVRALARFPARGTEEWRLALAAGLESIDPDRRERVTARLAALLEPAQPRDGRIAVFELERRLQVLSTWVRGRLEEVPSLEATARAAESLRRAALSLGVAELTRVELRRLCADVAARLATASEAGLSHVAVPGAVLAPAATVVWWGFTRDRAPRAPRLRLSVDERAALTKAGVEIPDGGATMRAEALRWRRPLAYARERLLLVAPAVDETGERAFPHPLWDEFVAAAGGARLVKSLERRALPVPTHVVQPRQLAGPMVAVNVPGTLTLREQESPSSLEMLLGCSLAWTLRYPAQLSAGMTSGPPAPGPLLFGVLAHHLLAGVLRGGAGTADVLRARAETLVDGELDRLCESLALPRHQVERMRVRQAVVRSAARLGELLSATGATVRGVEVDASASLAGVTVGGRADLLLRSPDVVIDHKWGVTTSRTHLERGTGLQLAVYAELFGEEGRRPETAFFILDRQELFGEHAGRLPGASLRGRHRAAEVWRATESAIRQRVAELARGEVLAPAADGTEIEGALAHGVITIAPPCKYCDFDALCGLRGSA